MLSRRNTSTTRWGTWRFYVPGQLEVPPASTYGWRYLYGTECFVAALGIYVGADGKSYDPVHGVAVGSGSLDAIRLNAPYNALDPTRFGAIDIFDLDTACWSDGRHYSPQQGDCGVAVWDRQCSLEDDASLEVL